MPAMKSHENVNRKTGVSSCTCGQDEMMSSQLYTI